ncbi:hypothetical protein [Thiomicrospira microaerophila]|uniref:hypothetical protein n=1 Tax=Thiomicrospira microaerophila TaxID=406020 RepID=UPI0005CB7590|nr:hypothetical protein [Thiomicrospira microaerophila]
MNLSLADNKICYLGGVGIIMYLNNTSPATHKNSALRGVFRFWGAKMSKRPFSKPHFTYAQQRKKRQQQGMIIDMLDQQAEHYLAHFNYYRLSGYWYDLRQPNGQFKADPVEYKITKPQAAA